MMPLSVRQRRMLSGLKGCAEPTGSPSRICRMRSLDVARGSKKVFRTRSMAAKATAGAGGEVDDFFSAYDVCFGVT